jgi:acyl-coenzyme A thioesterase PaaI-like protein
MAVDDSGLVHGGFTFSAADHAAMLAVNHPLVVLGEARVRYLEPVWIGELVGFEARVTSREGRRVEVLVEAATDRPVLRGEFICFILDEPLDPPGGK